MDGDYLIANQSIIMKADVSSDNPLDMVTLKNVKPCEKYGIQICAVTTSFRFLFGDDIWTHAWTGSMGLNDYGNAFGLRNENCMPPSQSGRHHNLPSLPSTPAPQSDTNSFVPQCNLVKTSYVDITDDKDPNDNPNTLVVSFSWDRKNASYQNLGPIDHYQIRYGPQKTWGSGIDESDAFYADIDDQDFDRFMLDNVPRMKYLGLQICAVSSADNSQNRIDWKSQAWLGSMDLTGYMISDKTTTPDMIEDSDVITTTLANPFDSNFILAEDDQDNSNRLAENVVYDRPLISQLTFGSNQGIILLLLVALIIAISMMALVWIVVLRKRRNAKTAPYDIGLPGNKMNF